MDCNLLVIAGSRTEFSETELQKIDLYLAQGGRLFALFNYFSIKHPTGLEPILAHWGVNVQPTGFRIRKQPSPARMRWFPFQPASGGQSAGGFRVVSLFAAAGQQGEFGKSHAGAPQVDELAFTSPASTLALEPGDPPHAYPLMVAVEQKPVAGVANAHGATRILVVGDSFALATNPSRAWLTAISLATPSTGCSTATRSSRASGRDPSGNSGC